MIFNKLLKSIALIIILGCWINTLNAQKVQYAENASKGGFQLHNSTKDAISLSYHVAGFNLTDVEVEGEPMKQLTHTTIPLPAEAGMPNLQTVSTYLLIPQGAQVQIKVLHEDKEVYNNMAIAPAPPIPLENEATLPAKKGKAYTENTFFPKQRYIAQTTEIRGMTLAHIAVAPFSYNPVSKQLVVYKNIDLQIQITGGQNQYTDNRFRSKYWDPIISDMILNKEDLPAFDYTQSIDPKRDVEGCEYLIVVPNQPEFLQWADTIKRFRAEQGIDTKVVNINEIGGNTVDQIKDYVQNIYDTWNPVPAGILLMADYGQNTSTITSKTYPHPYEGNFITDNYYADCTGNDLPDFAFARMTARNFDELEIMVNKFIHYEQNPPTEAAFYNEPITALGWQTERWFQICSEVVGGYMKHVLNKNPKRINAVYIGDPTTDPWSTATNTAAVLDYFGPNGQAYIPATPGELGNWTGGTAGDVTNALNAGAFMLQHRDHGFEQGWGEPDFSSADISQLTNQNKLSHIFSINCLTGRFNLIDDDCFTEKMHRYNNGGAVSLTAATQVSYSFVNDTYVWGLYDNMWPDFMPDYGGDTEERDFTPAFGNVAGKYFLESSSWPYNVDSKVITYRLFHHHGDVFGNIYTEVPQSMSPVYDNVAIVGNTNLEISNLPAGALVGLSVEGELIGKGIADDNGNANIPYTLQEPGTEIKIVITKQNYFRYQNKVMIIATEGPYVVKNEFSINDSTANNNQMADYDEDIFLNFALKNVGVETANNVSISISSEDMYVNMIDSTAVFGSINADEIVTKNKAFACHIANNVPDQHNILFNYTISDDADNEWTGHFSITANAPVLKCVSMEAEELAGNGNGTIDPGEHTKLIFTIQNFGHAATVQGLASATSTSNLISFPNSGQPLGVLAAQESTTLEMIAEIDSYVQIGTSIPINLSTACGKYTSSNDFSVVVGLVIEDWETADLTKFDWISGGNTSWFIDSVIMYEGHYSLRSGNIGDSQTTSLSVSYQVQEAAPISFYYKVSSEAQFDKFTFYIDGIEYGSWDGDIDWTQASFNVNAGTHIFKWEYKKDYSQGSGSDCAWIDNIVFPPMTFPIVNAGEDTGVCASETQYQLQAQASDYNSLEWSSEGDGSFSATDILNPVYTFGSQDIANKEVSLSLKAIGNNGFSVNRVKLYIFDGTTLPEITGPQTLCAGTTQQTYTLGEQAAGLTYTCEITPNNAATVEVVGNTATLNFVDNFIGEAQMNVQATNACGTSASVSYTVNVNAISVADFAQTDVFACGDETTAKANIIVSDNQSAPWEVRVDSDNGYSQTFTLTESPYEIALPAFDTPTLYSIHSITDANGCTGSAIGMATVRKAEAPTEIDLGSYDSICQNHTLELSVPDIEGYTYLWSTGATTPSLTVDYSMAINDVANISIEVSNEFGCTVSDNVQIFFKNCVGITEYDTQSVVLMPNPNDGSFSIDISALQHSIADICIYNTMGNKVAQIPCKTNDDRIQIQQSHLPKGMYILHLITQKGHSIHKPFVVR